MGQCCCYDSGVAEGRDSLPGRAIGTVFVDRDGVLNEKMPEGSYVTSWSGFKVLPGVVESIGRLNRARMRVLVVSNQRSVALGLCTAEDVERIHAAFQRLLEEQGARIDGFYFCPHDKGQCDCRKPLRGMFDKALADSPGIDAGASAMIGDSLSDIEFGRGLGMYTVLVLGKEVHRKPGTEAAARLADLSCGSLGEAVDALLGMRGQGAES